MRTELHKLHWLWKETVNRLDTLARDVREAKNVMEASNFVRWLNFSGLIQLFEDNPCTDDRMLVDAAAVQKKVDDLIYECGELFRGGKADAKYAQSDISEINRKLDAIMTALGSKQQLVVVVNNNAVPGRFVPGVQNEQGNDVAEAPSERSQAA